MLIQILYFSNANSDKNFVPSICGHYMVTFSAVGADDSEDNVDNGLSGPGRSSNGMQDSML